MGQNFDDKLQFFKLLLCNVLCTISQLEINATPFVNFALQVHHISDLQLRWALNMLITISS
jgi:hypothetical protein